jgi:hypothetical protein
MNLHTYKAVVARLQADGLESAARINLLLNQQAGVPDHGGIVEEICVAMRHLTESEGALITFQQYFGPKPAPVAPPEVPVVEEEPPPPEPQPEPAEEKILRLTEQELEKRSATHRKSKGVGKAKKAKKSDE